MGSKFRNMIYPKPLPDINTINTITNTDTKDTTSKINTTDITDENSSYIIKYINGGVSGMCGILISHPIDTIKTRIQNESCKTIKEAINKGGLNNGIGICLLRAFIVNGINFTVYENALKYLD